MTLTLEDLKAHLGIEDDADDATLTRKIAVAETWVAAFTGDPLTTASPAPLLEAVRILAGHLYESGEASLAGVERGTLPAGVFDLITPYRAWAF
ncbi:phage head-tail connector protein [Chelatococcus sambhunathii]|uniref:Phage head-tail connector protein n=1 Tax=Chelatococcus sambhunathii TaxID=363953 RepID=A0ABU1DEM1_9HYPH|nr:head-tail connector protein [Chelatococcus sambhunathii]MDR4306569.1 phage head-tail connector protein [Chelatococcus sambhunathii]